MVGLEAAVAYTDELERQFGRLEQMDPTDIEPTCAVIDRACRKLAIFLDELVAGAPPVPLKLFPEYEAMQRLRGVKAAAATDLFFPEMRLRTPLPGVPLPVARRSSRRTSSSSAASIRTAPRLPARAMPTARRRCARPRPGWSA